MSLYFISGILLLVSLIVFIQIAKKYNIVDIPNHRSSHQTVTIRGGGIIFPLSVFIFYVVSDFSYTMFSFAILLIAIISLVDDIQPLKTTTRLIFHIVSACLVIVELFHMLDLIYIPIILFIIIGGINAYNFMDGINGITSTYSMVVLSTLLYLNHEIDFINNDLIIIPLISVVIFSFFNFRKKAICFSGDVGSLSIALLVLFLLLKLIITTNEPLYALLLSVYAIDTAYTIIVRKFRGENVFKPHRNHLFQILVNEKGYSHLFVSTIYGIIQLIINYLVIIHILNLNYSYFWGLTLLIFITALYIFVKSKNERKII